MIHYTPNHHLFQLRTTSVLEQRAQILDSPATNRTATHAHRRGAQIGRTSNTGCLPSLITSQETLAALPLGGGERLELGEDTPAQAGSEPTDDLFVSGQGRPK